MMADNVSEADRKAQQSSKEHARHKDHEELADEIARKWRHAERNGDTARAAGLKTALDIVIDRYGLHRKDRWTYLNVRNGNYNRTYDYAF